MNSKANDSTFQRWKWLLETAIITLAAFLLSLVPFEGLEANGKVTLIIFLWCIAMWIVKPIPEWLTSSLASVVMVTFFGFGANAQFSGFGNAGWWLVVYASVLGLVMVDSGLGKRMAYYVISKLGSNYLTASYALCLTTTVSSAFIPSAGARSSTFAPIVDNLCDALGAKKGERGGESMPLACMFANSTTTMLFMTATGANVIGLNLVLEATGKTLSWTSWFLAAFIPSLLTIACIPIVTYKLYPPVDKEKAKKLDVSFAKEALKEMGPMRAKEKWTLFCFVLTVLLWATGDLTGMNANIVPMLTVVLVLIPPFVDKKAGDILRRIPWASMVWMGLVLGMSTLVENGGGFQWLADKLILNTAFISNMSFTVFLAFWIVLVVFIHIVFAGMNAMVAIFVPIGMAIAEALGFDAYTVGIITTMCVAVGANFFCFNSQSNVLFYAMERFTVKQQFLSAVVINFIACVCLLLTLLLFWPAIGLV